MAEVLSLCNALCRDTEGAYNINVLPLTSLWNFDAAGTSFQVPNAVELQAALQRVNNGAYTINGGSLQVNGGLDLGSVGKGYACDALAEWLKKENQQGIVSVGGSLGVVGNATRKIGIRDPFSTGKLCGVISLTNGFVSTSGSYEKYKEANGVSYHHLLDARTGMPSGSDLISVTVVAPSGALSDALATACFLMGSEKGLLLCEKWQVDALLITQKGEVLFAGNMQSITELF